MVRVTPTKMELDEAAKTGNPSCYLDAMLKRFKRRVNEAEIIRDLRKHEFFMPKSLRRKEKAKLARIKNAKK